MIIRIAALLALIGLYFSLRIYFRSVRREALERQFEEQGMAGDRDAWVSAQMKPFDRSLKMRLLWIVFLLPMAAIALIIYSVNYD